MNLVRESNPPASLQKDAQSEGEMTQPQLKLEAL